MNQQPPGLTDFNKQVTDLIAQFGAEAFCSRSGELPEYTLFVEEDKVVAESRQSPRHPYGFFCTLNGDATENEMANHLAGWLQSGEAYQEFLAMNVCRYNC